jgi:hypothetical protein
MQPKHPPGPPITLANMRELSIGLLAVAACALTLATSAEAIALAPVYQPEGVIAQIAYGCGATKTRVGNVLAEPAELSAGAPGGTEAFARGGTKGRAVKVTVREEG